MVRFLVTGARGGLARVLIERLRAPGLSLEPALTGPVEVIALGREDLDIARHEEVERAFVEHRPEVVLNTAGLTQVDLCESYQWEAYLVNRDGAEHLGRACGRSNAALVYFSTDLVFDGSKRAPYTEEDPPNPLSVYGDTKLAGELIVMKSAPRHLILRTGWLYGQPGRHFLKAVQEGVKEGEVLFGYDDHISQPTHVHDFVDALFFLLSRGAGGTYHVANAGEATQFRALRQAADYLPQKNVEVQPVHHQNDGRQAIRPRYSVLACGKLERAGFKMRPWEEALRAYGETARRS
ncbi:MAG: dTDP-4-dehydrorhamnose reductase [Planctomycetes bacterium]|nr:dTDP-4-dehydrorhamnose reductase [Planctomycetota bacterium]